MLDIFLIHFLISQVIAQVKNIEKCSHSLFKMEILIYYFLNPTKVQNIKKLGKQIKKLQCT